VARAVSGRRLLGPVLGLELAGFGLVILLLWLDEWLDLPHRYFHAAITPLRPEEFVLEASAVAVLGILVVIATWRVFRRLAYLESLLVICSWCRRVRLDQRWMSLEDYLHERGEGRASHGMCPACLEDFDHDPVHRVTGLTSPAVTPQ
jgi:hypothetical protein